MPRSIRCLPDAFSARGYPEQAPWRRATSTATVEVGDFNAAPPDDGYRYHPCGFTDEHGRRLCLPPDEASDLVRRLRGWGARARNPRLDPCDPEHRAFAVSFWQRKGPQGTLFNGSRRRRAR
jgi:hypothetical protein